MGLPKPVEKWARENDAAEREWARDAVDSWARDMAFTRPFSWGEAEAAVLAREYPPLPGSALARTAGVLAWVLIAILGTPLLGAAVVGFALAAAASAQDTQADAEGWLSAAAFLFVIAVIAAGTALSLWWETRRRSPLELVMNGANALAAGAAFAVLAASPITASGWLPVLITASGLISAVAFALGARSRPEGRTKRRKPPRRGPRSADKRARAIRARQRLLEVVVHRGLVDLDESDRIRIGEMPLGYWNELDGLDERERRRLLERRHVGWREFDAKDTGAGRRAEAIEKEV